MPQNTNANHSYTPFIILFVFGLLFFFIGIFNHYYFKTFSYDYANYNFAFWDYAHLRISRMPLFRGNFLQDHFSFTLMYFVPLYWLLNWLTGTYTLIVIQNITILVAALYSHKLIKLKTNNQWLSNGVLLYFFLLLGRYNSFASDVNLAIISSCFIPIFLYYFEIRKYGISFLILLLSLFSRENIPIWFIFIFAVLIISNFRDKKAVYFSLSGIVISLLYFIILFKIIIPNNESSDAEYVLFNYSALGSDPGEAVSFILRNPIQSLKMFFINHLGNPKFDGIKMEFYWVYLISGGFILLFRPLYLLWFIPIVAQKVLNDDPFRWGIATYYSAEVVTLLPLSVFLTLGSIKNNWLTKGLTITTCVLTIGVTIFKLGEQNNKAPWLFNTSKVKFYDTRFYDTKLDITKTYSLLKSIPKDAKVSSSNSFTPHLAQREFIYFFPQVSDAEYIVFSLFDDNYLLSEEGNTFERNKYFLSNEWDVAERAYPVYLLKRREIPSTGNKDLSVMWSKIDTLNCNFELIDERSKHILFSNYTKADTLSHISKDQCLSGINSVSLTKKDPYTQPIKLTNINEIESIEVSVWHYGNTNEVYMVLDDLNGYYKSSNKIIESTDNGWNRIILECKLEEVHENSIPIVYVWNSGVHSEYIDDLELRINHK